jgi:hypothetical protein
LIPEENEGKMYQDDLTTKGTYTRHTISSYLPTLHSYHPILYCWKERHLVNGIISVLLKFLTETLLQQTNGSMKPYLLFGRWYRGNMTLAK